MLQWLLSTEEKQRDNSIWLTWNCNQFESYLCFWLQNKLLVHVMMFYYYSHSWSYIVLSQFSLFNVRMYKITSKKKKINFWIISLHLWLRYWTHEYLKHVSSFCRVRLIVSQWCRMFILCDRVHVMEHVYETSVCPHVFVIFLCPQKWIRLHNLHFGLIIPTVFLPKNLHHVQCSGWKSSAVQCLRM